MGKETEMDKVFNVQGDEVNCYCKFENGALYSVKAYEEQDWRTRDEAPVMRGNLMPFLSPTIVDEIEAEHELEQQDG